MAFSLDRVLKGLLFGASGALTIKDIQRVFTKFHEENAPDEEQEALELEIEPLDQPFLEAEGMPTSDVPSLVTVTQIREAMDRIAADLEESNEVYRLVEKHNGFMLMSSPEVGEWIRLLRDEPRPMKLRQSALETLAVIAYRQPVVRSEIEKIRGVSIDSALSKLLERELVQIVGRADLPGRPIQYGTTEDFLEYVGVRSIEELPASDVLSPRQIDEWLHEASNQQEPTEKEMGLPEGERPENVETAVAGSEEGETQESSEGVGTDEEGVEPVAAEEASETDQEESDTVAVESELEADEEGREEPEAELEENSRKG